jgi:hypothetical protein
MVVKIRFGRGPVVARRGGKNSRIALLGSGLLGLFAICFASLGIWRLSQDVGLAGDFVFADGFLSHWQVWIACAALTQYCSWRLSRYARQARELAEAEAVRDDSKAPASLAANV